jgi:AraC family transcriptional regulator of adaptative response / DNA-3-methyladenine glycosylase II
MSEHRLAYRAPLARDALIGFLALRATPGVEQVSGDVYRRVISVGGHSGVLTARLPADRDEIVLELGSSLDDVVERVLEGARRIFDVDADPVAIDETLGADPRLRPLVERLPGLRVPGALDGFEIAVRAIVGQQISVVAARTIVGRLARMLGEPVPVDGLLAAFPLPGAVAESSLEGLGMPASRLATLRALAQALGDGALDLSPTADHAETRRALLAIRGVGPWTADYVALRALGDRDAFLPSDLVIRQVLGEVGTPVSAAAAEQQSQVWRPWRAYAVAHLWASAPAVRAARNARGPG